MSTSSPCIGFCRIDEASGICLGCARTREEITVWRGTPATVREQIWAELPGRRAQLGIGLHRLDWTPSDICSFISGTLRVGGGTWVIGVYGAVAEFCIGSADAVDLDCSTTHVTAVTPHGAIRLEITDQVRALALAATVDCRKEVLVLAVPRPCAERRPEHTGLRALGPDRNAIQSKDREEPLYDFGLGVGAVEFCVRTGDADLARELDDRVGQKWPDILANLGGRMLQQSPTRVVRSTIGRIEVFTPIPSPEGRSPLGPHTHFLPTHLAAGRETPPGLELPQALVSCAVFYPEVGRSESCT